MFFKIQKGNILKNSEIKVRILRETSQNFLRHNSTVKVTTPGLHFCHIMAMKPRNQMRWDKQQQRSIAESSECLPRVNGYWAKSHQPLPLNRAANTCCQFQRLLMSKPHHRTQLMLTPSGCKRTRTLTHIFLYSEVLLSQKTRPDALLSLKFPQPKLPVKTLFGRRERKKKVDSWGLWKLKCILFC